MREQVVTYFICWLSFLCALGVREYQAQDLHSIVFLTWWQEWVSGLGNVEQHKSHVI
jgi:hypothetical protein